jgi:hypothetical protein
MFIALKDAPFDMSGDSFNMLIKFSPNSAGAVYGHELHLTTLLVSPVF